MQQGACPHLEHADCRLQHLQAGSMSSARGDNQWSDHGLDILRSVAFGVCGGAAPFSTFGVGAAQESPLIGCGLPKSLHLGTTSDVKACSWTQVLDHRP